MQRSLIAAAVVVSAIALGACEEYGPAGPYADVDFNGYYDDAYGPFYGGYWGDGGIFYYADKDGRHFHRDTGHHFRSDAVSGYHPIQGHAPPARGGRLFGGHPNDVQHSHQNDVQHPHQ